jgi:hypothetical protein
VHVFGSLSFAILVAAGLATVLLVSPAAERPAD